MEIKEKQNKVFDVLKKDLGYKNPMQTPKIEKVIISIGAGSKTDKNKREIITDRLSKITGQKPAPRGAKQSIAAFKTREGDVVGYQVTLRGERMNDFLEKLFNVALPRTKDFRGVKRSSVDEMGNCTIGIPEHTIFVESPNEDVKDIFGFAITIVTSAKNKEEAEKYLEYMGMPFKAKA